MLWLPITHRLHFLGTKTLDLTFFDQNFGIEINPSNFNGPSLIRLKLREANKSLERWNKFEKKLQYFIESSFLIADQKIVYKEVEYTETI